jgi:hypothetical protein
VSFPKGFKTLAGPGAHSARGRFFIYRERFMPVKGKTKEDTRGIQIRFPTPMYEKLRARAKDSLRSLNAEVIVSLEKLFAAEDAILEAYRGKEDA